MKIFPTKELEFKLIDDQEVTLGRLNRRTEKSESLISRYAHNSFRGIINGKEFKLISSAIGRGAFCVMKGKISGNQGSVKVEIHKTFKIILGVILILPVLGVLIIISIGKEAFSPTLVLVAIGQVIIIRYLFIELAFRMLSNSSLNRLRDVLDIEWK